MKTKIDFKPSCPGSRIAKEWSVRILSDGRYEFVVVGERDIQSEIQSFAESCDINTIMNRYLMGDQSVLSRTQGFYGDFMSVPRTYAEVLQSVIDGRAFFDALPLDVRQKFGSDFSQFYAQIGSSEWYDIMKPLFESKVASDPVPVPVEPVAPSNGDARA